MAKPRAELNEIFCNILGSRNVYFNPPDGQTLKYPCIVYNLSGDQVIYADNHIFNRFFRYEVTLMDRDIESKFEEPMSKLPFCRFQRSFINDNMPHWVYEIFF